MKDNSVVNEKTEQMLDQVSDVADKMYSRIGKIDFGVDMLGTAALEDMKIHLGYTKNYSDLAKVRLQYLKMQ